MINAKFKNRIVAVIIFSLVSFNLSGCGTILHPERKGQISGQIDPTIAVLNGIGLLFFLVPGVVAFAVDFSNGTIYLPGGSKASLTLKERHQLVSENGMVDTVLLKDLIQEKTNVSFNPLHIKIEQINTSQLQQRFESYMLNQYALLKSD